MKTFLITGACGAIGGAITEGLAGIPECEVWMLGRDPHRLEEARAAVLRNIPAARLHTYALDLGMKSEIQRFATHWRGPLHVLINNAATVPRRRTETTEGREVQWAVNVLAYYRLSMAMAPFMLHNEDARIVMVSSYWAGGMDLSDPEFRQRPYDNDLAYRQSKQANRMMTAGMAYLPPFAGNITINVCHPGDVNSKLSNNLGFGGHESPAQGAETPVFLATSPLVKGVTGKYFAGKEQRSCEFASDTHGISALLARMTDDGMTDDGRPMTEDDI